jgi:hypothetical protein
MSNSEASAIVFQGIPCMCGLYKLRFEWRKRFAQGSPRFTLSRSHMRSRTGLASPVENQACGDPGLHRRSPVFVATPIVAKQSHY